MAVHVSHSLHLRVDGLSASYPDRRVFTDLSFSVAPGHRLGLIGENGVGKSTLLRLIAGETRVDASSSRLPDEALTSGTLTRPRRIGLLAQDAPFAAGDRIGDVLDAALAEVRAIERELAAAASALAAPSGDERRDQAAAARYSAALDAAERAEVWSAGARRDELLQGLGVAGLRLDRRMDEISGGQRRRFALAALLLRAPDALLLDEPTNHLDDVTAAYLEGRLRAWRGPVVLASHDREFLDRVATGLLDLDPGRAGALAVAGSGDRDRGSRDDVLAAAGGTAFGGGFSEYLAVRSDELERWRRRYEDQQEELRRLRADLVGSARTVAHGRAATDNDKFVRHFKGEHVDQAVSRRVRSASLRLEALERAQLPKPPAPLEFAGIPAGSHALEEASGPLLQLSDVAVDGRLELESLRVSPSMRLLVTGANGAGKSTLLGVLAGTTAIDRGTVHRRRGVRVRLLEQEVRFADPRDSARRLYERTLGERRSAQVPLASLGLLAPRDLDRPLASLSVGQQRRLALALVIARPPHLFLLDEPTNHLSLALATDLEAALGSYPGAVLIASHDRWLRRRWDGERLELAAGRRVPASAAASRRQG